MKGFLLGIAVLLGVPASSAAEVVFRGSLVYTAAEKCDFSSKGFQFNSVFHPS